MHMQRVSSTHVVIFVADTRRAGRWLWLWAGGLWHSQQDQCSDRRRPAHCWTERSGELIFACWNRRWCPTCCVTVNKTANNFFPWLVWIDSLTSLLTQHEKQSGNILNTHFISTFSFSFRDVRCNLHSQRRNYQRCHRNSSALFRIRFWTLFTWAQFIEKPEPSWPQQNAACLLEHWWLCYDLARCLSWLHTPFITSASSAHPGVKHKEGRNNWKEKQLVVSNKGTNKASHYNNNNLLLGVWNYSLTSYFSIWVESCESQWLLYFKYWFLWILGGLHHILKKLFFLERMLLHEQDPDNCLSTQNIKILL